MKFGICTGIENAQAVKTAGYDYFECVFSQLGAMEDAAFAAFERETQRLDFYPEAMNIMLSGNFRLTGDTADLGPVRAFLLKAFARAEAVGGKVVVFGSSRTRNLPDGFERRRGFEQLVEYLLMAGEIAARHGMVIAIEPLRFEESNIINFYAEGAYLAARVNLPNVRCLADYYHIAMNEEDTEGVARLGHRLAHCHIARKQGHFFPLPGDGQDYTPFFSALKAAAYGDRLSIEAQAENGLETDAPKALAYLRSLAG